MDRLKNPLEHNKLSSVIRNKIEYVLHTTGWYVVRYDLVNYYTCYTLPKNMNLI